MTALAEHQPATDRPASEARVVQWSEGWSSTQAKMPGHHPGVFDFIATFSTLMARNSSMWFITANTPKHN